MKSLFLCLLLLLISFTPVLAQVPPINMNGTLNLHGSLNLYQLPDPPVPTIKQIGQGGYTHYTYVYFCNDGTGYTTNPSPSAFVTGPATLNGSNNNQIQYSCPIGSASASIVRTDGSLQYVSKTAAPQGFVVDQGVYAGTATLPSSNTTGIFYGNGSGLTNISGGGGSPLTGVVVQSTPGGPTLFNSTDTAGNTMNNAATFNNPNANNGGFGLNVDGASSSNGSGGVINLSTPINLLYPVDRLPRFSYGIGAVVYPPVAANAGLFYFAATTPGTSSSSASVTWPQTNGLTVVDGGVTWTAFDPSQDWVASTAYPLNFPLSFGVGNVGGYLFQVTIPGTSGLVEPVTWNQTPGGTTVDGGVTWKNVGLPSLEATASYDIDGMPILRILSAGGVDGDSIGVGVMNLVSNTTGNANVAVGYQALFANTTGSVNTAVGVAALQSNTTGAGNSAVGRIALQLNTTGLFNIAFGQGALTNNLSGNGNTALGEDALGFNSVAVDHNTAVGYLAFQQASGADNTGIGYNACGAVTTGASNICVGQVGNITTGSSNILIGNSLADTVATTSNQLDIGDTIEGTVGGPIGPKFGLKMPKYIVSGEPTCNAAEDGVEILITDALAATCVAATVITGSSGTYCNAVCKNGTGWVHP